MLRPLLIATVVSFAAMMPARAGFLEPLFQTSSFPVCDDEKVLNSIVKRFNDAEEKTWKRGLYMSDVRHIQARLLRDGEQRQVPRRYCRAVSSLSNGRERKLFYLIEAGGGFAGNGYNLEFCVEGLDPWRIHDGSCRALRY